MFTPEQVKLAARLYELRDTARRIAGDSYDGKISIWTESVLVPWMRAFKCSAIEAVPRGAKLHRELGRELSKSTIRWLTAAAVEYTEKHHQG